MCFAGLRMRDTHLLSFIRDSASKSSPTPTVPVHLCVEFDGVHKIIRSGRPWLVQRWVVVIVQGKGKADPLQAWNGLEGSRKLRFPDFMTTAQDGGKVISLTHRPPFPQEMLLVLISVRGWVDHKTIVRSEGFYVNENFQWHQLGSNQRPSNF